MKQKIHIITFYVNNFNLASKELVNIGKMTYQVINNIKHKKEGQAPP